MTDRIAWLLVIGWQRVTDRALGISPCLPDEAGHGLDPCPSLVGRFLHADPPIQPARVSRSNRAGYGVIPVPKGTCRSSPRTAESDAWTLMYQRCAADDFIGSASGSAANAAALPVSKLTPKPPSAVRRTISRKMSGGWQKSV